MTPGEQILAIDVGTQSTRALIFDPRGNLIARSQVMIEPYFSEQPGWAEQHPATYWEALCEACQGLWTMPGVDRSALAAVAVTTQRGTMINLDRDGEPLRPAIVWLDQRRTTGLKPLGGIWGTIFSAIRMSETIAYFQAEAEANWIRTYQPDIWERSAHYLLLSGFLTHRLTGRYVDSVGAQVGYFPFDYQKLRWASKWDWKWQAVPMDSALLPELVSPTGTLGEITAEAAEATGIPAGLPLVAAATDKACEALGAGIVAPDLACLSYGTSATVIVTPEKYHEVRPLIPPFPSAIPDRYNMEVQIYRGYWMVNWFKHQFAHDEQARAQELGTHAEALFEELIRSTPPGSMGLMLQPYWSPGLKVPGPEAKGAVIGFGDVHTRAHLYRAILEGLAYSLREGTEQIQKRNGRRVRELRVAGGGSQSDGAMQLTADIFGMPAARPHVFEASGLGAAIDAAVGVGLHRDISTAVGEMTRTGTVFEPDPEAHATYDALYHRVYRKMYEKLKPLYEEIRQITGYPARL